MGSPARSGGPPSWFYDLAVDQYPLSLEECAVFLAVCSAMKRGQDTVQISRPEIERRSRASRSAVFRSLKSLTDIGLLEVAAPAVGRSPATYRVPEHMPWPTPLFGKGFRATHDGSGWRRTAEP